MEPEFVLTEGASAEFELIELGSCEVDSVIEGASADFSLVELGSIEMELTIL